jgi:ABC-type taurine transport system substrate-binding protein
VGQEAAHGAEQVACTATLDGTQSHGQAVVLGLLADACRVASAAVAEWGAFDSCSSNTAALVSCKLQSSTVSSSALVSCRLHRACRSRFV